MEEPQSKKFNQAEINFIKLQITKYQSLNDPEGVLALVSFLRDFLTLEDRNRGRTLSKYIACIKVYSSIQQSDYIDSIKSRLHNAHTSIQILAPKLFYSILQILDKLGFQLSESQSDEDLKILIEFYQKPQSTKLDIKEQGGEQQDGNIADKGN